MSTPVHNKNLVFVAPLSAGFGKSFLKYDRVSGMCAIVYPNSGRVRPIPISEGAELLVQKRNRYGLQNLQKISGLDLSAYLRTLCEVPCPPPAQPEDG